MIPWGENKDRVIGHFKYQIEEIVKLKNVPLYSSLKPCMDEYIKKIEVIIREIELTSEENFGWFEFDRHEVSYGYNNNNFISKMKKCYAEENFSRNCTNLAIVHLSHKLDKFNFSEQEEKFLEKFYSYIGDNNFEKFNEVLKSEADKEVDYEDEKLETIKWIMCYFWDKVFSEEELIYIIKNGENTEENILLGQEQIKKNNALKFYLNCKCENKNLTSDQYEYSSNLRTIAYMYNEDKDMVIDEKYTRGLFQLVSMKKYSSEEIFELVKNSTVEDKVRVHLVLEINNAKADLKKLEHDIIDNMEENTENYSYPIKWRILTDSCIREMTKALDILGDI